MPRRRLTDDHPAVEAFYELCEKAQELGIQLTFLQYGVVEMLHSSGTFKVEDCENGIMECFPSVMDVKFTFDSRDNDDKDSSEDPV